ASTKPIAAAARMAANKSPGHDRALTAHKQALALFSTYAQSGDDPALKVFAEKTLPTLRMHEKHVKELAAAHS
ncbi:DUF4142 domain-containing protein, partial [Mesorhizobium sp.]|uniref:DUF4142 domain-containing protein n=1 Tax=Mesorhizobium sp. TaxID=1871066 RepID=UPI0011FDE467